MQRCPELAAVRSQVAADQQTGNSGCSLAPFASHSQVSLSSTLEILEPLNMITCSQRLADRHPYRLSSSFTDRSRPYHGREACGLPVRHRRQQPIQPAAWGQNRELNKPSPESWELEPDDWDKIDEYDEQDVINAIYEVLKL